MTDNLNEQFMDVGTTLADLRETTSIEATPSTPIELLLYDIFIPLLGFFIILLNLLVVFSSGILIKKGQHPRSTYLFLGNVALSDLVTGIAVIFGQYYPSDSRNECSCAIQIGLIVSSTLTSVYSVALIGLDRFLYILYGLQYECYIYPTRARFLIIATWILGLVIGFLPAMGWRGDTDNGKTCWFILLAPSELILLTTIIGLLPILLVVVLYSIILYKALKKVNQLKRASQIRGAQQGNLRMFTGRREPIETNETISDTEQPLQEERRYFRLFRSKNQKKLVTKSLRSPSKWKAIKVVLFTTLSFVITWIPFFIVSTWYVFCDFEESPELCVNLRLAIAGPLAVLGFANSLINPFIYAWWHNGFRESVKNLWKRCCNHGRTNTTTEASELVSSSTQNTNIPSTSGFSNN